MKINLPKNYRSIFTLEELDQAKTFIAAEREDTTTPAEVLETIARYAFPERYSAHTLTVETVEACGDHRIEWDPCTGRFTAWIAGWVYMDTPAGEMVVRIGTTLYEYWNVGPDHAPEEITVQAFKEC